MSGTILENLSGKKLSILVACLLLLQFLCFLLGGLIAPVPASVQTILATICKDVPGSHNDTTIWLYSRGEDQCRSLDHLDIENDDMKMANQIVFVFQMPLPREGRQLDYSRWQQNLIGVLQTDIVFDANMLHTPHTKITIDARLAYRNKGDSDQDWKYLASSLEERDLDCTANNVTDDYLYNCNTIPLFELGSLHHDFYLLNVRLPVDSNLRMNLDIGHIRDLHLSVIYQNGGFTKVWVSLKTAFLPFICLILAWFWQRVHLLQRKPALLEVMLLALGCALTFLNLPLEYFTLFFDMPFMLLLSDIRQGIFYAALLSFWLVFAGEHMLLGFIISAGISAGLYFFFLCYMIWKVFCNINIKRTSLPSMSSARRLHYEGIIYRFQFLMLATLLCAALTIIGFIIGQVSEGRWKWDENIDIEFTSAFFTGVYGMWNIYIFALIVLYAPSHKKWPTNETTENIMSEEIEFSNLPSDSNPSEISSLTQFARKAAQD
ncbi:hypothetical protein ZHAS_00007161 [Anopheles sinensis]|uniref:Protein wntless n=1 Tax=Anopheles sinensis TaxID=74873 RepID=A0A084VNZ6_ANOSI|nr:hypothetical protein ZHAS_00007161 [Anopheles sinensis]